MLNSKVESSLFIGVISYFLRLFSNGCQISFDDCIIGTLLSKPKFTLDEFFNYTEYLSLILSPDDGQSILIQTRHHIWDQNINEEHLHLQTLRGENRKLITTHASYFKPQWKGDLIALILESNLTNHNTSIYIRLVPTKHILF
jgi:hypothetical protein